MRNKKYKKTSKKTGKYRSKFESDFAAYLDRKKVEFQYENFTVPYVSSHIYYPDFPVLTEKLSVFFELKGRFTAQDRSKMLLVKNQNPWMDIRLVFMQDNLLYKGSKTRYSDWCVKHGFKYHVVKNNEFLRRYRDWETDRKSVV